METKSELRDATYADTYWIRYCSGRTMRVYHEGDALVKKGQCLVVRKQRPIGLFNNEAAAEVFCKDFKGKGWLVLPDQLAATCPMCHGLLARVVDENKPETELRICRECGFHTNKDHGK